MRPTSSISRLPLLMTVALLPLTMRAAAETAPDKRAYSLSIPVPVAQLREMSTDRPDTTESPFTVDAGHAQLEMDLLSHARNRLDGTRTTALRVAAFNWRFGITNTFEAGIFVSPWTRATEQPRGALREVSRGFGDVRLRAKFNFWGNDGGGSAGGLIVDLKLPTAARGLGNDAVEGGVILPMSFELPGGWELGAMTKVDLRAKDTGSGRRKVWVNTITTGRDLTKAIGAYVELTSETGDGTHVATFDVGVTFKLNAHTQLDCGAKIGLSRAADDLVVFTGLSRRF